MEGGINMFCKNTFQQISLDDTVNNLPNYLKNNLMKSWAHAFQEYIFPNINEERFSVLYSDNYATRPNSPVNVIVGLLIIKEIFGQSDEDLIASLYFDIRYQYALKTTSYEKQPVSINTLYNFRKRLYDYDESTGIDLIKLEVEELSEIIAKYLKIDNKQVRMDSFMVSSSCKKLTRIELVYSVNAQFIKHLNKIAPKSIPKECEVYLEKGHKNKTIYKTRDVDSESKLEFLLKQSKSLYNAALKAGNSVIECEEFLLLERMLGEQLEEVNSTEISPKLGKEISSESLQNPTDPDATYRKKYGDNIGYVGNVAETFDDKNSVITHYDLKPNTYSDSKFADDVIEELVNKVNNDNKVQLIVDGAYYEQEKAEEAQSKGINIIPGELTGRKPSEDKMSYTSFQVDEQTNVISQCAYGKTPIESHYSDKNKSYTAKFSITDCASCSLKDQCRVKKQKKFNTIKFSAKSYKLALQREKMNSAEYIELTNKRAGVEGIPSVFRRKYRVDRMPVRGFLRSKLWFGFKVAAYNFKKLLKRLFLTNNITLISFTLAIINIFCNQIYKFFNNKEFEFSR